MQASIVIQITEHLKQSQQLRRFNSKNVTSHNMFSNTVMRCPACQCACSLPYWVRRLAEDYLMRSATHCRG